MTMNRQIEQLLVSYVNGTASREEVERAQAAIRGDQAMAAEHRLLMALRSAVKISWNDTPGEFGVERFRRTLERYLREERRVRFWRALTAFAACLVVGMGALHFGNLSRTQGDTYQVLQGTGAGTIQVRFQPTATNVEIQDVARDLGLEIVAGPSVLGVYRMRLRQNNAALARSETLRQLRERPRIVEFAELDP